VFPFAQDTTHSSVIFYGGIDSQRLTSSLFTLTFTNLLMVGVLAELDIKGVIWCQIVAESLKDPSFKDGSSFTKILTSPLDVIFVF